METVNYKVIKEFGNAEVGEIFKYDGENEAYMLHDVIQTNRYISTKQMYLVPEIAEVLVKEGYLEEVSEEGTCENCNKIEKITEFVYQQIENFKKANTEIADKYDKGEIQPCVKVESDTVHYNLLKVLNHIKDIINE